MLERARRSAIGLVFFAQTSVIAGGCDDAADSGKTAAVAGESDAAVGGSGGSRAGSGGGGSGGSGGAAGHGGTGGASSSHAGAGGKAANTSDAGTAHNTGGAGGSHGTAEVDRATVKADEHPSIDDQAYNKLIAQLNHFGLELGRRQEEANKLTDQNSVYSPLSAAYALSMTYAGARADTAKEMGSVLAGDISTDSYHTGMNRLARELASRALEQPNKGGNVQRIELNIADAVYVDQALHLQDDFLNELSRDYDSGVHREDFQHAFEPARMHINDWVADKTHDKIQDLLPAGSITDRTRLVLVNALYFYGSWNSAFSPSSTSSAAFHALDGKAVDVPTMHAELRLSHATGTGFSAVELPYVGGHLRMTVVLPDDGQFEAVRKAVSSDWLAKIHTAATSKAVRIALPKFKMTTSSFSLTHSLMDMGMNAAFTDKADFSGISTDEAFQVADVIQKAFISVDENGTEAAAATAVTVTTTSVQVDVIDFTVDRPFLFFIQDDDNIVLFSGHVVKPAQ